MVALKTAEIDAVRRAPRSRRARSCCCSVPTPAWCASAPTRIIRASVDDPRDPFALVRLDGDELASEPSRLVEEANTMPLFGGRRAVWVKAGSRNFAAAVETLLAAPPTDCRVVIEAGDLRRNAPLRTVCERAKTAAVDRLLRRQRARSRAPDRRRDARGQPCASRRMRARRLLASSAATGRPRAAKFASSRSTPTARIASRSTTCSRSSPMLPRWRSMPSWMPPSPDAPPRPKRNSPKPRPPARRPARLLHRAAPRAAAAQGASGIRRQRERRCRARQFHSAASFSPQTAGRSRAHGLDCAATGAHDRSARRCNIRKRAASRRLAEAIAQRALLSIAVAARQKA